MVNFNFLFFSTVAVCVFPDVPSEDKSHIPFSPDDVNYKIVHESQELSSLDSSTPPSLEENKIVLEEQSPKEEIGLKEKVKGNTVSTRFILLY